MAGPEVKVAVFADTSRLKSDMAKAEASVASFGESAKRSGNLLKNALIGTAVIAGFRAVTREAQEAIKVQKETERVLKTTGASAWVSAKQVGDLAQNMSKLTGVDDEVIQSGENVLLTFTRVKNELGKGNDVFNRTTKAALDMSTVFGTDMQSAVVQLGKALNDPIKGLEKLGKAGVSFTADQKALITSLAKSGDLLGAQKVILAEVEKEFGGAAAAAATPLDKLKVSVQNLEESVGVALMPALNAGASAVGMLADAFSTLPGPVQVGVIGLASFLALAPKLSSAYTSIAGTVGQLAGKFSGVGPAIQGMASALGVSNASFSAFASAASSAAIPVVGALAAGVTVLTIAWQNHAAEQARNAETEKTLTAELQKQAAAIDVTTEAWLREQFVTGQRADIGKTLAGTTADIDKFTAGIREQGTELDAWRERISNYGDGFDELRPKIQAAADAGDGMSAELLRLVDAGELQGSQVTQLIKDFDFLNDRTDASTAQYNVWADVLGDGTDAVEGQTQAIQDNVDAMHKQQDAVLQLAGGQLGLQSAQIASRDALADYNEKMKDGTLSVDALDKAGNDLLTTYLREAQSTADLAQKQLEATGKTLDAAGAADIQRAALETLRDTLAPNSPLRAQLQGYIDALSRVPRDVSTTVHVDTYAAAVAVAELRNKLSLFRSEQSAPVGIYAQHNAIGGPVGPGGGPRLVGEYGPELFVPSGTGRIVSTFDLSRSANAAQGGQASGGSPIHISIPVDARGSTLTKRQIQDAVMTAVPAIKQALRADDRKDK